MPATGSDTVIMETDDGFSTFGESKEDFRVPNMDKMDKKPVVEDKPLTDNGFVIMETDDGFKTFNIADMGVADMDKEAVGKPSADEQVKE